MIFLCCLRAMSRALYARALRDSRARRRASAGFSGERRMRPLREKSVRERRYAARHMESRPRYVCRAPQRYAYFIDARRHEAMRAPFCRHASAIREVAF